MQNSEIIFIRISAAGNRRMEGHGLQLQSCLAKLLEIARVFITALLSHYVKMPLAST